MRQVIIAKDIQIYFGKKESMSFKILSQIKKDLGKQKHQPITITEFCEYFRVDKEGIVTVIKKNDKNKIDNTSEKVNSEMENNTNGSKAISSPSEQSKAYAFTKRTW
jgi:hypothetical protein